MFCGLSIIAAAILSHLSLRIIRLISTCVQCFLTGISKLSIQKKSSLSDVCPNVPNSQYAKLASFTVSSKGCNF